jgi:hypothetical protein
MIFPIPLTHRLERSPNGGIHFFLKACDSSHSEEALQVYSAVGTCAVYVTGNPYGAIATILVHVPVHVRVYVRVYVRI